MVFTRYYHSIILLHPLRHGNDADTDGTCTTTRVIDGDSGGTLLWVSCRVPNDIRPTTLLLALGVVSPIDGQNTKY